MICVAVGTPVQNYCELCDDCVQYCMAICTSKHGVCPADGYCVTDLCLSDGSYCGAALGEYHDASCDDGFDNDDDGFTDCGDFDCTNNPGITVCGPGENTDESCSNDQDDDDDGFVDCADFNCSANPNVIVCG